MWSVLVGVHVVWMWPTFTATHTIQAVVVGRVEPWSDMKRACAICHEYSWHAPLVSFNSMVVVTNGAILVPDGIHRHMHRFAPFLGLLGAERPSAHRACE